MNEAPEQRWPPWYGPAALVIGLVAGLVGGAIAVLAIEGSAAAHNGTLTPAATDVATLIQDVGFVGAVFFFAALTARPRPAQFGLRAPYAWGRALLLLVAAAVVFVVVAHIYFSLLNQSGQEKEFVKQVGGNATGIGIVAVCGLLTVVAPVCEEILFRGFIFRSLANWRDFWPAAILTGLLFGGVHGLSAPAVDLAPLALFGFLLCVVYHQTGSIYLTILAHAINNSFALAGNEGWGAGNTLVLLGGTLAALALLFTLLQLASARWTPASD